MRFSHLTQSVIRVVVPMEPTLRRLKRRFLPYEDDPGNSDYCITNGLEQLAALRNAGVPVQDATILEFGSGWLPLIPLLFHLAGARRLILTDVVKLMDAQTVGRAKVIVASRMDEIAEALRQSPESLQARLRLPFEYDYLVPWDAAAHPAGSVDLIISRAVFEHVPKDRLRYFLAQFHRILRPGGTMCHVIDNSDHWQHQERSLSRVDFLRYEEVQPIWRLAQTNLHMYQNRLRHDDYRQLFTELDFRVTVTKGEPDPICLDDLGRLPLASQFRERDHRDLAILTSLFVVQKPD
jgi:SAM-dependent methyltransferase